MAFGSSLTKSHLAQLSMGSILTTDYKVLPRLADRSPSHMYIIKTTCRQAANIAEAPAISKGTCGCLTALTASHSLATAYCTAAHHQGLADKCRRNTDSCILYPGNLLPNLCGDACKDVEERTVPVLVHQCPVIFAVLFLAAL